MLIGVDETGGFDPGSSERHWCVAAIMHGDKADQFKVWEQTVPNCMRAHGTGEVKGSLLTLGVLESFVREVLEPDPSVRLRAAFVIPAEHPPALVNSHRADSKRKMASDLQEVTVKKELRLGRPAADWLSSRKDGSYLWLAVMSTVVAQALLDAIVIAVERGCDSELTTLKVLVDERGIKAGNLAAIEGVRQAVVAYFMNDLGTLPPAVVSILRRMEETGHPLAVEAEASQGSWKMWPAVLRCDFTGKSHAVEAIRVADIVATILSRFDNPAYASAYRPVARRSYALAGPLGNFGKVNLPPE